MASWRRTDLDALKASSSWPCDLFLDDGGVLNDNCLRGPEWVRLIGEFMPPRLGGTAEQWATANRLVVPEVWEEVIEKHLPTLASPREFEHISSVSWMSKMCARLGITPLPDDDAVTLHRELSIYVAERASAAIPGAADAVRALHSAGFRLYTASGTTSRELLRILGRMGIAEVFVRLYGPDLVDHVKYGPAFYEQVFAHAGVPPARALVIESDSECCGWATEAGANAVWVDLDGRGDVTTLAALVQDLL